MKNLFKRSESEQFLVPRNNKIGNQLSQDKVVNDLLDTMKNVSPQTITTIGIGVTALIVGFTKLIDEID